MGIDVRTLAEAQFSNAVIDRRYLHEHPELSGQEENTVRYICEQLDKEEIPYVNVPNGGVIATIHGCPGGKTVMLRADIDALPVDEPEINLSKKRVCRSQNPGVMHACGHDAHTAMLLGAGRILNQLKDQFCGTVILNFERGEEGGGNWRYLVEYYQTSGVKYDICFGMHVEQKLPAGTFGISAGPSDAGVIPIDLLIKGRGGHGSRPDLSDNPIDCMTEVLNQINQIRVRHISPFEPFSLSICHIEAGSKGNIIPDTVLIQGSARYFSTEHAQKPFCEALDKIVKTAGIPFNCEIENRADHVGMPLINDEAAAKNAEEAMKKIIGADLVKPQAVTMGSESFQNYFVIAPGCYANLGIANPEVGSGAEIHNCYFDIDEEAMKTGMCAHVGFALNYFGIL